MGIVILKEVVTKKDLDEAKKDYGEFIKVVADLEKEMVAIGGQWHADAEKLLLEAGCSQKDIWGGGVDLATRQVDTFALINVRPGDNNNSQEILNNEKRNKFIYLVKKKFGYE